MTINDLRSHTSVLQKSTEANSFKQENDAEARSSKKAKCKKGKDPVADLDAEGPEFSDNAHGSLRVHLANGKPSLALGSDNEPEF